MHLTGTQISSRLSALSNIRQLRIQPVVATTGGSILAGSREERYIEQIRQYYDFHDEFWGRNNARFERARVDFLKRNPLPAGQGESEHLAHFHRSYLLQHRQEFAYYHRKTLRMHFELLLEEYRMIGHYLFSPVYWLLARLWRIPSYARP